MKDNTNAYRFRTTHKGVYLTAEEYRSGVPGVYAINHEGQPFEDVELHGLYGNRIAFHGWVPSYGTFKLERQQLMAYIDSPQEGAKLMWHTIETKYYEEGEQQ